MSNFSNLKDLICCTMEAHTDKNTKEQVRRWDGETPYFIHPIWCALMILQETGLPKELRIVGYQALLCHDVREDTEKELPAYLSEEVDSLVNEMTFVSSQEEFEKIWDRSDESKLLKLYDKVSNLLDGSWMSDYQWNKYCDLVRDLVEFVEGKYGKLNIIKLARAIAQRRNE